MSGQSRFLFFCEAKEQPAQQSLQNTCSSSTWLPFQKVFPWWKHLSHSPLTPHQQSPALQKSQNWGAKTFTVFQQLSLSLPGTALYRIVKIIRMAGRCGRGSHLLPEWESMEQDANSCFEETLLGIKLAQLRMRQGMSRNTGHIGKSWQIHHEIQIKLLSSLQLSSFFGSMMNPQGLQADRNPGKLHSYEQEP